MAAKKTGIAEKDSTEEKDAETDQRIAQGYFAQPV